MVKNYTKWYFLEPFLNTDEKLHLNRISKKLDKPHPVVRRYLNEFCKEGILRKEQVGRQTHYSIKKDHSLIIEILTIAEKEKLMRHSQSSLMLKELVRDLHEGIKCSCLIFGSFASEERSKSKDIDVLAVGKTNEKEIDKIGKKLNKDIHLINVKSLNEISDTLKKEIFSKHLIVNNSEMFVKWLH